MTPYRVPVVVRRNWPGMLSILLAIASVAMYWLATVILPPTPYGAVNVGQSLVSIFQIGAATSALVGFLAVLRARRGHGGLATGIIGLLLGGTLTFLWVAWIVMMTVLPCGNAWG